MEIFWRFVLGHLIGDFTLQTNYIAAWKRRNLWGMLAHCGIHPIIYAVILWKYIGQVWIQVGNVQLTGVACILLIFVMHFIEDEWRVWSVLKKGAPDNTFFYLWDQVIHYAFLFTLSPVADGGSTSKFGIMQYPALNGVVSAAQASGMGWVERFLTVTRPEPWVFIAILFVIVTHFTTVTIYFIEKDWFGVEFPETREKYVAMAERLAVALCLMLPGAWWVTALAVWLGWTAYCKLKNVAGFTWTNLLVGNATALLCGFLSRVIYYRYY